MRQSPTPRELEEATELLFNVMIRCFAYFLWWTRIRPILEKAGLSERDITLQRNTVIEGTLLSIRKINDFFRPRGKSSNEQADDVFSYDFQGFSGAAKFLHPDDFSELHKRIGHITLREIRHGKVSWEIHNAVVAAAKKYIEFSRFLQTDFFALNERRKCDAAKSERIITEALAKMERCRKTENGFVT
jgi:hypothetical protein